MESYYAAKEYGFESDLLEKRIKALEKLSNNVKSYESAYKKELALVDSFKTELITALALCFLMVLLFIAWIIKKRKKTAKSS